MSVYTVTADNEDELKDFAERIRSKLGDEKAQDYIDKGRKAIAKNISLEKFNEAYKKRGQQEADEPQQKKRRWTHGLQGAYEKSKSNLRHGLFDTLKTIALSAVPGGHFAVEHNVKGPKDVQQRLEKRAAEADVPVDYYEPQSTLGKFATGLATNATHPLSLATLIGSPQARLAALGYNALSSSIDPAVDLATDDPEWRKQLKGMGHGALTAYLSNTGVYKANDPNRSGVVNLSPNEELYPKGGGIPSGTKDAFPAPEGLMDWSRRRYLKYQNYPVDPKQVARLNKAGLLQDAPARSISRSPDLYRQTELGLYEGKNRSLVNQSADYTRKLFGIVQKNLDELGGEPLSAKQLEQLRLDNKRAQAQFNQSQEQLRQQAIQSAQDAQILIDAPDINFEKQITNFEQKYGPYSGETKGVAKEVSNIRKSMYEIDNPEIAERAAAEKQRVLQHNDEAERIFREVQEMPKTKLVEKPNVYIDNPLKRISRSITKKNPVDNDVFAKNLQQVIISNRSKGQDVISKMYGDVEKALANQQIRTTSILDTVEQKIKDLQASDLPEKQKDSALSRLYNLRETVSKKVPIGTNANQQPIYRYDPTNLPANKALATLQDLGRSVHWDDLNFGRIDLNYIWGSMADTIEVGIDNQAALKTWMQARKYAHDHFQTFRHPKYLRNLQKHEAPSKLLKEINKAEKFDQITKALGTTKSGNKFVPQVQDQLLHMHFGDQPDRIPEQKLATLGNIIRSKQHKNDSLSTRLPKKVLKDFDELKTLSDQKAEAPKFKEVRNDLPKVPAKLKVPEDELSKRVSKGYATPEEIVDAYQKLLVATSDPNELDGVKDLKQPIMRDYATDVENLKKGIVEYAKKYGDELPKKLLEIEKLYTDQIIVHGIMEYAKDPAKAPKSILNLMDTMPGIGRVEAFCKTIPNGQEYLGSLKLAKLEEAIGGKLGDVDRIEDLFSVAKIVNKKDAEFWTKLLGPDIYNELENVANIIEHDRQMYQKYANKSLTALRNKTDIGPFRKAFYFLWNPTKKSALLLLGGIGGKKLQSLLLTDKKFLKLLAQGPNYKNSSDASQANYFNQLSKQAEKSWKRLLNESTDEDRMKFIFALDRAVRAAEEEDEDDDDE